MKNWKRLVSVSMVALMAAATMAQDYTPMQRSRSLALDNPENTYMLGTDGKYNHWYSRASLMAGVTVTITKQTGAVTATAAVTAQRPGAQTPTITVTKYTASLTNVVDGVTNVFEVVTNVTAACSALLDYPTNATVAVTIVGGAAVMTNATASVP